MTLLIMSITVVSLLVAFSTAFSTAAVHRNLAVSDTVLRSVSEQVYSQFQQTTSSVFAGCPTASDSYYNGVLATALTPPSPYSTSYHSSIGNVLYWSGANFSLTSSTCIAGTTNPEQMTLTVLGPNGETESTTFVVTGSGQIIVAPSIQLNAPTLSGVSQPLNTVGGLALDYGGSSNAPLVQTYTANACLDAAMTLDCVGDPSYVSGSSILGLLPGTTYFVTVTAVASTGYISATSSQSQALSSGSAVSPTVTSVAPSSVSAGALVVTFAGLTSPPTGQTYTATACTDTGMTSGCVVQSSFISGSTIGALVAGTTYYVTIRADTTPTTAASTSVVSSPAKRATVQLLPPSSVVGSPSTSVVGVINVTFVPSSNAPANEIYSATACTNLSMTTGCVSAPSVASGGQVAGLVPGTTYYVTIGANASTAYLSATSAVSSAIKATTTLSAPAISSTSSPATGTAVINFTGSSNAPSGQTYSAKLCTDTTMSSGCVNVSSYSSGANILGLNSATIYYATITANADSGYLASTSSTKSVNVL